MNYAVLHAFANKHRVPYNELCTVVRDAVTTGQCHSKGSIERFMLDANINGVDQFTSFVLASDHDELVHDLATLCDPAGLVAENGMLRDQTRQLVAMIDRLKLGAAGASVRSGMEMTHREAMDLASLATVESNKLRDTGRPCFTEQAAQMESLGKRIVRWIESSLDKCQDCGGIGAYSEGVFGRDACVTCDGSGRSRRNTPTVIGVAIAKALSTTEQPAAQAVHGFPADEFQAACDAINDANGAPRRTVSTQPVAQAGAHAAWSAFEKLASDSGPNVDSAREGIVRDYLMRAARVGRYRATHPTEQPAAQAGAGKAELIGAILAWGNARACPALDTKEQWTKVVGYLDRYLAEPPSKDAERLDWLEANGRETSWGEDYVRYVVAGTPGRSLRQNIDAARAAK